MIHGILNVYKEKGYTSHDVVAKLRGILGQKKIGHTGTLDPDATGVLPVCLGKATKLCDMLTDKDKCYDAVLLLGKETDTQDASGNVICTKDLSGIGEESVRQIINSFIGGYDQVPPMYSALKVNGRKLYELAREGKTVERKARRVELYDIHIRETAIPRVHMKVHCSKGTYIRTLCHDIGQKLGCGACMETLIRTKAGVFEIEGSHTLKDIEEKKNTGRLTDIIVPIDAMFPDYVKIAAEKEWEERIRNGASFPAKDAAERSGLSDLERVRVYDQEGTFIGIYKYEKEQNEFTVVKMFYPAERD